MADAQDRAEGLDEDNIGGQFPPGKLMGAEAYGAAGADPGAPESVIARAARENPEEVPSTDGSDADLDLVILSEDDPLAGDPSTRDVATEKGDTRTAEESAMHVVNEELPDFDSEVDDPALEAAWELDPEVER